MADETKPIFINKSMRDRIGEVTAMINEATQWAIGLTDAKKRDRLVRDILKWGSDMLAVLNRQYPENDNEPIPDHLKRKRDEFEDWWRREGGPPFVPM